MEEIYKILELIDLKSKLDSVKSIDVHYETNNIGGLNYVKYELTPVLKIVFKDGNEIKTQK